MRIISGKLRGKKLYEVESMNTRSTTDKNKEMLFNTIGQYFDGGLCLDLFAGSGSLGIESLSRGIDKCYFFDISKEALDIINKNIKACKFEDISVVKNMSYKDALNYVKGNKFDIIFLDPPFKMDIINELIIDISKRDLLKEDGIIVCQTVKDIILDDKLDKIYKYREKVSGNSRYAYYEVE